MRLNILVYGIGNAKCKRSLRGMEKDWNKFGESVRKFMQHGDSMKKSPLWIKYKKNKRKYLDDE